MSDYVLDKAVLLTKKLPNGAMRYRISPRALMSEHDIPKRGFLSNWCTTEKRAWHAARCRRWHQVYSRDASEFE